MELLIITGWHPQMHSPEQARRAPDFRVVVDTIPIAEFGKQGGKRRAKNMTPEERKAAARKAVQARWAKEKNTDRPPKP
jgi:hypothetical protein